MDREFYVHLQKGDRYSFSSDIYAFYHMPVLHQHGKLYLYCNLLLFFQFSQQVQLFLSRYLQALQIQVLSLRQVLLLKHQQIRALCYQQEDMSH